MRHPVRVTTEAEQDRQLARDRQVARPKTKTKTTNAAPDLRAKREYLFKELTGRREWAQGYFDRWGPGTPTHVYLGLSKALDAYEASGDHDHGRGPIAPGRPCDGGDCLVSRVRRLLYVLPRPVLGPADPGRATKPVLSTWRVSFVQQRAVTVWVKAESRDEAEAIVRDGRYQFSIVSDADLIGFTGCWSVSGKPEDKNDS